MNHFGLSSKGIFICLFTTINLSLFAQFPVTNECNPTATKATKGEYTFERSRYINLGSAVQQMDERVESDELAQHYINTLDMSVGRGLGMILSEYKAGKTIFEDPKRKGFVDIERMQSAMEASTSNKLSYPLYEEAMGVNQDLVVHEKDNAYPTFMELYSVEGAEKHLFPANSQAAAELVANMLKYNFTDFTRPKYYEIVNEPKWQIWNDQRFIDQHLDINKAVDKLGLDVNIGGPCLSVSNFYKNNFQNLRQITDFIDKTDFKLDFYSFHSYDYMNWNRENDQFEGAVNSGIPLEGVLDAIASHTYNNYGRELSYVASEHGGYIPDLKNRREALDYYGEKYFPTAGEFEFEMEKRGIDNFVLMNSAMTNTFTYINHPHIVKKAVPFILLESASWNPEYYSCLLVKKDFDRNSAEYVESKLIYFYNFFKEIKGRYINSWCDATDIQHFALVDDNKLMLMYHNQSNEEGEIAVNIHGLNSQPSSITVRRLGANATDKRPYYTEKRTKNISTLKIAGQESVALIVDYPNEIAQESFLDETPYYATEQGVKFSGSHTFKLNVKDLDTIEDAFLRVGIHRSNNIQEGITITVNGKEYQTTVETAAPRLSSEKGGYVTLRVVQIPVSELQKRNKVTVSFADGGEGGVGAVVLRALHNNHSH